MLRVNIISEILIPDTVVEYIEDLLNTIVIEGVDITITINEDIKSIARNFYNENRRQINGEELLTFIRESINPENFLEKYVIIIDDDAYVPGLNFIFGIAEMCGNIAIVFTERLKTVYTIIQTENIEILYYERLKKEILHELGHTLCLEHCINKKCVMSFSNSVLDVDYKDARYCERCIKKIRSIIHWKKL